MNYSGKVIFDDGTSSHAGIQVVIWTTNAASGAISTGPFPDPFIPFRDAVTDASGEFSFDIPDGQNNGFTAARVTLVGSGSDPVEVALLGDSLPDRLIVITAAVEKPADPLPEPPVEIEVRDPCKFELRGFDVQSQQRYVHLARVGNHEGKPPKVKRYKILETRSLSQAEIDALKDAIEEQGAAYSPKMLDGIGAVSETGRKVNIVQDRAQQLSTEFTETRGATKAQGADIKQGMDIEESAYLQSAATSVSPTLKFSKSRVFNLQTLSAQSLVFDASLIAWPDWWAQPPRYTLDCDQPIDWDYTPTIVQACEPYYYHVLEFVQEVIHAGYQEGPIVGTSTLLPCQERKIATLTTRTQRQDSLTESQSRREGIQSSVTRALDVKDLQSATMREASTGSSSSSVKSVSAAAGAVLLPVVLGVSGGASKASSVASQNSSRAISGMASQNLRDSVRRAAESIRSSTATIVRTATDQEDSQATTEIIKNHSPTRTLDLVTHEIYSAFDVQERLTGVREAIAVPFRMTIFDDEKALRWREALAGALPDRTLARGFDSIERILNDYAGAHVPPDRFADAEVRFIEGTLELECRIQRPAASIPNYAAYQSYLDGLPRWHLLRHSRMQRWMQNWYENEARSAAYYAENVAPRLAQELVHFIQVKMVDQDGNQWLLPLDPTPLTKLDSEGRFTVSFNMAALPDNTVTRANLKYLQFQLVNSDNDAVDIETVLPEGSALIIHSGAFDYQTDYDSTVLFRNSHIRDDISGLDVALVPTPLSRGELVSPVDEDVKQRNELLQELNTNLVVYHEVIYNHLAYNNPSRLRMILDGLFLPGTNEEVSVRDVIGGFIGAFDGCVVFYVGPGHNLTSHLFPSPDPDQPLPLLDLYAPDTPPEPLRITTPSGSTFTKTYLGHCPLREPVDNSLAVDWDDPCGTSAPSLPQLSQNNATIQPLQFTAFTPTNFKDYLSGLDIPDNSALGSALTTALSRVFNDITGLAANQTNAMTAFNATLAAAQSSQNAAIKYDLAKDEAEKPSAKDELMAAFDNALQRINIAEAAGNIDEKTAKKLREKLFETLIDGVKPKDAGDQKEKPADKGTTDKSDKGG